MNKPIILLTYRKDAVSFSATFQAHNSYEHPIHFFGNNCNTPIAYIQLLTSVY